MSKPLPPFARTSETSRLAAISMYDHAETDRARVYRYIRSQASRGATADELEPALRLSHQNASARVWELSKEGLIERTGEKRRTRSGRQADVWRVVPPPTGVQPALLSAPAPARYH